MNRVFERHPNPNSYERRRVQLLLPLMDEADYFLDLHSFHSDGQAFGILDSLLPESEGLCLAMGIDTLMSGWPDLYATLPPTIPSKSTQSFADQKKVPNALIECGRQDDPASVDTAYRAVLVVWAHL